MPRKVPNRIFIGVGKFDPTDAEGPIRDMLLLDNETEGTTNVAMREKAATHGTGLNFLVLCVCWGGGGGHADCLRWS